jgi:hypothetical protein
MGYQEIRNYSERTCSLPLSAEGRYATKLAARDGLFNGWDGLFNGQDGYNIGLEGLNTVTCICIF